MSNVREIRGGFRLEITGEEAKMITKALREWAWATDNRNEEIRVKTGAVNQDLRNAAMFSWELAKKISLADFAANGA